LRRNLTRYAKGTAQQRGPQELNSADIPKHLAGWSSPAEEVTITRPRSIRRISCVSTG
jgi:hypothetical protein